jgi:hypothetical protein
MPTKAEYGRAIGGWHKGCMPRGCPYECGTCVGNKFNVLTDNIVTWEERALRDVGIPLEDVKLNYMIGKYDV